jgi:hypothetical protein
MLIKGKMNELYTEKEGWESERRNLEEMCGSLMSEVERLRASTGGGLKLEPSSSSIPRPSRPVASSSVRYTEPSTSTGNKRTPVACPICPDPDPDCPCQQPVPAQSPITTSVPVVLPHQSDCGLCTTPAECLCRVVADNPSPSPALSRKGKCDVCPSLAICLCEDDSPSPPLPRASAAVPLSLRSKSRGTGIEKPKQTFWRLDNVVIKGEAVCSGDPSNCDACRDDSFGMFSHLILPFMV